MGILYLKRFLNFLFAFPVSFSTNFQFHSNLCDASLSFPFRRRISAGEFRQLVGVLFYGHLVGYSVGHSISHSVERLVPNQLNC